MNYCSIYLYIQGILLFKRNGINRYMKNLVEYGCLSILIISFSRVSAKLEAPESVHETKILFASIPDIAQASILIRDMLSKYKDSFDATVFSGEAITRMTGYIQQIAKKHVAYYMPSRELRHKKACENVLKYVACLQGKVSLEHILDDLNFADFLDIPEIVQAFSYIVAQELESKEFLTSEFASGSQLWQDIQRHLNPYSQKVIASYIIRENRPYIHHYFERLSLFGHTGEVTSIDISADGTRIISGSADATIRMWNAKTGQCLYIIDKADKNSVGHTYGIQDAIFSPDASMFLTVSKDDTVKVWRALDGSLVQTFKDSQSSQVHAASWSNDGSRIVFACDNGTAQVGQVDSGEIEFVLRGHQKWVISAFFNHDDSKIVTASGDGTARVWDRLTERESIVLRGHESQLSFATFSPDGKSVATTSRDATAKLWDARIGSLLHTFDGHAKWVRFASFTPDGSHLITTSDDGTTKVWSLGDGNVVQTYKQDVWVHKAILNSDDTKLITITSQRALYVWDMSGGLYTKIAGHTDWIKDALFSPRGNEIITASYDKTIKVWEPFDTKRLTLAQVLLGVLIGQTSENDEQEDTDNVSLLMQHTHLRSLLEQSSPSYKRYMLGKYQVQ